jgi:N-acetylglucosamine-6-phosphate deacetylase
MASLLIKNAKVITSSAAWERGWLLCEGQTIKQMGHGNVPDFDGVETVDAGGLTLLPGFIDVHVHGAMGYETMDGTAEGLRCMAQFYAQHGVTSFLPTTWTERNEPILAGLKAIAAAQGQQPDGATIVGAHLEGPYINVEKCGAQNPAHVRRAGRDEALAYLDLNVIRLVALAPEFAENHWLIEESIRRGITVSAAHTAATYDQIRQAVEMGLSHATHTYNAMIGLNHREPGTLGAAMTSPEIACELIADNVHVHPAAMQILFACKGADGIMLITDSVRAAGMPDGEYKIDERTVIVRDGTVKLPSGTLAGSIVTLDLCLRNFMQATGQPVEAIWQTSSLNAARAIHLSDRKGSLEVGKDADLVLVDDDINVHLTVAEGRVVYRK